MRKPVADRVPADQQNPVAFAVDRYPKTLVTDWNNPYELLRVTNSSRVVCRLTVPSGRLENHGRAKQGHEPGKQHMRPVADSWTM